MKTNSLRIGNYVLCAGKVIAVTSVFPKGINAHTDRITGDMEPSYHTDCDTLEKVAAEIPHSFCAADAVA